MIASPEVMEFFTAEHLYGLHIGDVFKTEGLFKGVDPNATVKWEVVSIVLNAKHKPHQYIFEAFYYRISLGRFQATIKKKGEVEFREHE